MTISTRLSACIPDCLTGRPETLSRPSPQCAAIQTIGWRQARLAPCGASAGRVEPVFVDDIAEMPRTIAEQARDGDVVISMGAGSIGNVPAQVSEMLKEGA